MHTDQTQHSVDTLIIGAGLSGLSAAVDLQQAGHNVLLVDKGRGLGGRLAGRRIGDASFDHGAQFMTTRNPRFAATVQTGLQPVSQKSGTAASRLL